MTRHILAIDPATACGWAHSNGPSGTWDLSVRPDESSGMRLVRFQGKLDEIRRTLGIDLVVFEGARFVGPRGGDRALVTQAEIQGVLKRWCEEHGLQYRAYSPSEVKKLATGSGNAKKEKVLDAARARWPEKTLTYRGADNEADALWLLTLAARDYAAAA